MIRVMTEVAIKLAWLNRSLRQVVVGNIVELNRGLDDLRE